ncbi:MAG: glycosyltransferase family 39 protein [Candidatus Hydrogenedentes bacterium]|nr:glycosyltransferase family 39 protein [Candidatus Hydrogenedentota bacterium]
MTDRSAEARQDAEPKAVVRPYYGAWWLILILGFGLALRLINLGAYPYWHDEVHGILLSEQIAEVYKTGDLAANHPPLYVTLIALWRALGLGENEWTMRALSVVLGLCGIWAIYLLGRLLFGTTAGLCAAFLIAVSPVFVFHSQELKEYVLLPFTGTIMVYFFYRAVQENRAVLWAAYGLMAGVACYSEIFVGPMLVAINFWFLLQLHQKRDRLLGWILSNLLGALIFLPYLRIMLRKTQQMILAPPTWWLPKPTPWSIVYYLKTHAFGYSDLKPHFKIALAVFCLCVAIGFIVAWRRNRPATVMLLLWCVLSPAIIYTMSWFTHSIFLIRALGPYSLPLYLAIALFIATLPGWFARGSVLTLFAAMAATPLFQYYQGVFPVREFPHRPGVHAPAEFDKAAAFILERWKDGDVVVHTTNATWLPFFWYGFRDRPQFTVVANSKAKQAVATGHPRLTVRKDFDAYFPNDIQPVVADKNRVWCVYAAWEREYLSTEPTAVWRWLDAHYSEILHAHFRGMELFLYDTGRGPNPVNAIARNDDDGHCVEYTYVGGLEGQYRKCPPDWRILPAPVEKLRGRLNVRFDELSPAPANRTNSPYSPRRISFSIENRSDKPIQCRLEFVPSDVLLDLATLDETEVESDAWRVGPRHNPKPPPDRYMEAPVAVAHFDRPAQAGLAGGILVPPGAYRSLVNMLGEPESRAARRAPFSLTVANQELMPTVELPAPAPLKWSWRPGNYLTIPAGTTATPVRLTARATQDLPECWADVAYVALRKVEPAGWRGHEPPPGEWPGVVTLEPHKSMTWAVDVAPPTARADLWVYELEEGGRAYRIFRKYGFK